MQELEEILANIPSDRIWMIVAGFVIAFLLAFGIGANDVANSFGTSVGSKVLTLRQAFVLATIFETTGAVLLGAKVSDTIRTGIIDVNHYENNTRLLMIGNVASLTGSCVWLIAATLLRLPVSATHSIVGATVGFALVAQGSSGIRWFKLVMIMSSWVISPVLSGGVSVALFGICNFFILRKKAPLEPGLRFLPIFYALIIMLNVFSIFYDGPEMLNFHLVPIWGTFIIAIACGVITALIVYFLIVPWQRKRILKQLTKLKEEEEMCSFPTTDPENDNAENSEKEATVRRRESLLPKEEGDNEEKGEKGEKHCKVQVVEPEIHLKPSATDIDLHHRMKQGRSTVHDAPETAKLFSFLQVLTAVCGSFAHGGNDVSNSIGPLISLWLVGTTGLVAAQQPTPILILLYGGFGISVGLVVMGRKVIKTIGEDLAKVTPSSGFCIEIGAALTVLFASNVGLPISTTHCKVGSVVFVGRFRARENVDWSIFRNIVLAWLVTLPVCGGISAAFMAVFQHFV